jgi:hypothetical protein
MTQSTDTLLSIIIPAYNEEGAIGDTVVAIQDLNLEAAEILVIDDGSSDATARVASCWRSAISPYNIGNGSSKVWHCASRGKVLVF